MNMPILGQTKERILRELLKDNLHGYELARRLNIPITGIYQHLKELAGENLIRAEAGKDRRKIYTLTKKGEMLVQVLDSNSSRSK